MQPAPYARLKSVFVRAQELRGTEREAYLAQACGDDVALRSHVERLLEVHDAGGGLLAGLSEIQGEDSGLQLLPERIGDYVVRGVLGIGGMGVVYRAEQQSPRRSVAVKVLGSGPVTRAALRRFAHEADVLGRLTHPGIAQIYESGTWTADRGEQPFLVMELVEGLPLTHYCATQGLELPERLRLVIELCRAVHHAHQRGVVHRDLKPANILVTADGRAKILDFGVAKLIHPDERASTLLTGLGQLLGTLAYMSPEQVEGGGAVVDARSDVYALGVITYELVSGVRPHDLSRASLTEAVRIIREEEPQALGSVDRAFRGDLETVVAKALAKEATRRYWAAADFADDLERYLRDEPIVARPPSTIYQLRKLMARHRMPFALTAVLAIVLLASAVITAWLAVRFAGQRNRAFAAETQAGKARDSAEEFARFLENLFNSSQPDQQTDQEPSLRQVLDDGYERLPEIQDALVRARLMTAIGDAYSLTWEHQRARELLQSAVEIRRRELGDQHPDVVASLRALADLYIWRGEYDAAEEVALQILETQGLTHGESHPLVADAWELRGQGRYYAGDLEHAVQYFQECLAIRDQVDGPRDQLADTLANVGRTLTKLGRYDEAEPYLRDALALQRELGDHEGIEWALEGLALLVWHLDRQEAEEVMTEELAVARAAYHALHPRLPSILTNYAFVIGGNHGPAQAEPFYLEAVEICRKARFEGYLLGSCLDKYSGCLLDQQKYAEAVRVLQQAVQEWSSFGGPDDPRTISAQKMLDEALAKSVIPAGVMSENK